MAGGYCSAMRTPRQILEESFRRTFGGQPGEPEDLDSTTLDQSLFLKHGDTIRGLIAPRKGNLTHRLGQIKEPNGMADELFLSVYSRLPTDEERADVAAALQGPADRPAALREVVWALIASAEFRFNH